MLRKARNHLGTKATCNGRSASTPIQTTRSEALTMPRRPMRYRVPCDTGLPFKSSFTSDAPQFLTTRAILRSGELALASTVKPSGAFPAAEERSKT